MPLPEAEKDRRLYELLKTQDLENLSYADFQAAAEAVFVEDVNEDTLRRIVLIQLARMSVAGEWNGILTSGGTAPVTSLVAGTDITLSPVTGLGDVTINATPPTIPVTSLVAGTDITLSPVSGLGDVTINAASPVTSLVAGTDITLSPVSGLGDVTINATPPTIPVTSLIAGTDITLSPVSGLGDVTINAAASPVTSLIAGTNLTLSPVSGLGDVTINADTQTSPVTSLVAGTNVTLSPVSGLGDVTINADGGAPDDAQYVTLATDATLTNERVLTAGANITITDAGAGNTVTIEAANSPVTSLVAGTNVTLSPASGLGNVTINATGGGGGGSDNYAQDVATSQGLSVPAYFLMGMQNVHFYVGGVGYNTGSSGYMNKWTAPSTGTSGISIGVNIGYGNNHYLWVYEQSATGYAGTFVGKIKLPGSTPGFAQATQWLDAVGSIITSPTFTKGQQYVSVLEFSGAQNYYGELRHYQNFTPVVKESQFTSTSETFGMRYTGTISATMLDSNIDFLTSDTGWPLIGLEL